MIIRREGRLERGVRRGEPTASGLPMSFATVLVASERMAEVSTPSKLALVERLRHGISARLHPPPLFLSTLLWSLNTVSSQSSRPFWCPWAREAEGCKRVGSGRTRDLTRLCVLIINLDLDQIYDLIKLGRAEFIERISIPISSGNQLDSIKMFISL